MLMYNLIEYNKNYVKTLGGHWQYYKDDPHDNTTNSKLLKLKARVKGRTPAAGSTKDAEIFVKLKYLRSFWKTLEMINCEINLILTWSVNCFIND